MSQEIVFFKTRAADSKWSGTKEEKTWPIIDVTIIKIYNFKTLAKRVNNVCGRDVRSDGSPRPSKENHVR